MADIPILPNSKIRSFWTLVDIGAPDDCWNWKGNTGPNGYGRFRPTATSEKLATHRIALALEGPPKPAPPNDNVLHACANRLCCNPRHLRYGSAKDNSDDRWQVDKGAAFQPINPDMVRYIRNSAAKGVDLARKFNISTASVSLIRNRKLWAHVD